MSDESRSWSTSDWAEYGIPAHDGGDLVENGSRRGLRQLIRR